MSGLDLSLFLSLGAGAVGLAAGTARDRSNFKPLMIVAAVLMIMSLACLGAGMRA